MTPADKRRVLIDYLRMKADDCDWHGVQDAASDLRDLQAAHPSVVVEQAAPKAPAAAPYHCERAMKFSPLADAYVCVVCGVGNAA